jgi:hypothetical protein
MIGRLMSRMTTSKALPAARERRRRVVDGLRRVTGHRSISASASAPSAWSSTMQTRRASGRLAVADLRSTPLGGGRDG